MYLLAEIHSGVLVASSLAVPFGADKQTTAGQQEFFVEKLAAVESFVLADVRAELLAALLVVEGGVLQV